MTVAVVGLLGCTGAERTERGGDGPAKATRAALVATTRTFGWKETGLGFRPAGPERRAQGPEAIAVGDGGVFVLDAVNGRVMRVTGGELSVVASVPKDAVDLAVGPDGAIAVLRQQKPEVVVLDPSGAAIGAVDVGAVTDATAIALGPSRRVSVTSGFQETFAFGSPNVRELPAAVLANKREGAARLASGEGIVGVREANGDIEIRVVRPSTEPGAQASIVARHALGKGDAVAIAGASGTIACARVERVTQPAADIAVEREAVCVDAVTGREVLRAALPPPGAYVPRRELVFGGGTLAFARPTDAGLEVLTWSVR
jgi:hypothetical protein